LLTVQLFSQIGDLSLGAMPRPVTSSLCELTVLRR
jgi:hypothetical protein